MNSFKRLKERLGVLLFDYVRYTSVLKKPDKSYLALCNRNERLEVSTAGNAYRCAWQWASDLHAPKHIPNLGLRLMKRALNDHPLGLQELSEKSTGKPEVCFIIGHRGLDRLPHLLATLKSIAGQSNVLVECIVVEQDVESKLVGKLPRWVKHIHTPPPTPAMPYCRSWTFNVGAKESSADILVLHDNDMLVPADYSEHLLEKVKNNFEVINLKRFIFYLHEEHTRLFFSGQSKVLDFAPDVIVQNLEAGGSVAITKKAYEAIGGFDEDFIGWGGEDNEFWERACTLKVWSFTNLPIIHLWHKPQPEKLVKEAPGSKRFFELQGKSIEARIELLNHRYVNNVSNFPLHKPFS